jgi:hypothetical protein
LEQWWPACTDVDGFHAQERAKYDYLRLVIFDLEAGVFLLYAGCLCGECDDFATLIARQGIQASADYQSLFTVPYFRNNIYDFPTSEFYGRRYVILSCGSDETEEGLEYIIQATKKW